MKLKNKTWSWKSLVYFLPLLTLVNLTILYGNYQPKTSSQADSSANEKSKIFNVFNKQHLAFGNNLSQGKNSTITLPSDTSNIEKINIFIKLECPSGGCNIWDTYGNIYIKDKGTNQYFEIARFMTPYGVPNFPKLKKGFKVDVTDFKSLLKGEVEFRAFIEVWKHDGWLLSVDIEFVEGEPDYKFYEITPIFQYNRHSLAGVPYGEKHNFVLTKRINIPKETQDITFRTIISGWGHATPFENDDGSLAKVPEDPRLAKGVYGRGCAEWCFRKHKILINQKQKFIHNLNSLNCHTNPINNQRGNWKGSRAGWCPGMEVPIRRDEGKNLLAEIEDYTFDFEYEFFPWTNDFKSPVENKRAFYALSSFIVVKSDKPITKAQVSDITKNTDSEKK